MAYTLGSSGSSEYPVGSLTVTVISASGESLLRDYAYCTICTNAPAKEAAKDANVFGTKKANAGMMNKSIEWKEKFCFSIFSLMEHLQVSVYTGGNVCVGKVTISISQLPTDRVAEKYFQVLGVQGEATDVVLLLSLNLKITHQLYSSFATLPFSPGTNNSTDEAQKHMQQLTLTLRRGLGLVYSRITTDAPVMKITTPTSHASVSTKRPTTITSDSPGFEEYTFDYPAIKSDGSKSKKLSNSVADESYQSRIRSTSHVTLTNTALGFTLIPSFVYADKPSTAPPLRSSLSMAMHDPLSILSTSLDPFIEYFLLIGHNIESPISVCDPSSKVCEQVSEPRVLFRYPEKDRENVPLPSSTALFCMPNGCHHLKRPSQVSEAPLDSVEDTEIHYFHEPHAPLCFGFCMSDTSSGLYGTSILFWGSHSENSETISLFSLSFLSKVPNITTQRFLLHSLLMGFSSSVRDIFILNNPFPALGTPLLRKLTYICDELRVPVDGLYSISFEWPRNNSSKSYEILSISSRTSMFEFSYLDYSLKELFSAIDFTIILKLLACLLCEHKVLLRSSSFMALIHLSESLVALMTPFVWQHVHIPVLPHNLVHVLDAPVPFLIGIHSSLWSNIEDIGVDLSEVVVFDMDSGGLEFGTQNVLLLPSFPAHITLELRTNIFRLLHPAWTFRDYNMDLKTDTTKFGLTHSDLEYELRLLFLQFISKRLLQNYRNYLFFSTSPDVRANLTKKYQSSVVSNNDSNPISMACSVPYFDVSGFLMDKPETRFYSKFFETQVFTSFLEAHQDHPAYLDDLLYYTMRNYDEKYGLTKLNFVISYPTSEQLMRRYRLPSVRTCLQISNLKYSFEIIEHLQSCQIIEIEPIAASSGSKTYDCSFKILPIDEVDDMQLFNISKSNVITQAQLSTNFLKLKSQMEINKKRSDNRLYQCLQSIFLNSTFDNASTNDIVLNSDSNQSLAELASLGNLLRLKYWRDLMFDYLMSYVTDHARTLLPLNSFNAICFLVSVTLDECQLNGDFKLAYKLLCLSEKFQSKPSKKKSPVEIMKDIIGTKRLFQQVSFWLDAVVVELEKWKSNVQIAKDIQKPNPSPQASESTGSGKKFKLRISIASDSGDSDEEPIEAPNTKIVFSIIATLIVLMNSILLPSDTVTLVVINLCSIYEIGDSMTDQLITLVVDHQKSSLVAPTTEASDLVVDSLPMANFKLANNAIAKVHKRAKSEWAYRDLSSSSSLQVPSNNIARSPSTPKTPQAKSTRHSGVNQKHFA